MAEEARTADSSLRTQLRAQLKNQIEDEVEEEPQANSGPPALFVRASRSDVGGFYRSFGILVEAEYPIAKALIMLANSTSNDSLAGSIRSVAHDVENGVPLSEASGKFPWYFNNVDTSVMKSAEETARLGEALDFMATNVELEQEVRDKATEAVAYPAVVLVISTLVITGVLSFAAPKFAGYIVQAGGKISGLSAFVFSLSDILTKPFMPVAVIAVLAASIWFVLRWKRNDPEAFHKALSKVPIFGSIMMQASIVRFVNMFHMLSANGVTVPQALELSRMTVDNAYLQRAIADMKVSVEQGRSMGEVLKSYKGLPPAFVDMMTLAEQTGRLGELLPALSRTINTQLSRRANRLAIVAEPVLISALGVAVLLVMIAFFMPYIDMLGSLASQGIQ